jgi:hypothetical protein
MLVVLRQVLSLLKPVLVLNIQQSRFRSRSSDEDGEEGEDEELSVGG